MSVNKRRPHIVILPEDDANRQISTEFVVSCRSGQIKVENSIGGWAKVVDRFLDEYAGSMRRFRERYVVLIIDCDNDRRRISQIRSRIPEDIADRVFILGSLDEPERLRAAGLGSFEKIGRSIASGCEDDSVDFWMHDQLQHNLEELDRIRQVACSILWAN